MSNLIASEDSSAGEPGRGGSSSRRRRPPVQLGDLPHEIKDLIVRHCHGADHNVDSMIRRLEGCGGLPTDSDCNLYDVRRTYRRTVAVFYEVSMEWRSLCAPYRFGKLLMSRVADDYFHLVIAPTHGHHFVDIEFDATAPEQIVEFIKALPFLPNLRTINLTRKLHDGIGRLDAPLQQAVEERLDRVIGTGIRDLTLDRLPLADIFRFTTRAPNILNLSGPADWLLPTLEGVTSALLPRLRMLTVHCRPAAPALSWDSSEIVDRVKAIAAEHDKLEVIQLSHPYARLDSCPGPTEDSARHRT
ncbi:hypothetical protein RHOSPDRAFT_36681 [Rhodotorula sp. JG-1b]|nr:hypothetical protein RHOSPDRAFT_36681 [Rhodotorula sp. JG-1b]